MQYIIDSQDWSDRLKEFKQLITNEYEKSEQIQVYSLIQLQTYELINDIAQV